MADTGYGGLASAFLSFAGNQITNEMNAEQHATDMATYLHTLGKQREWQKQDQQWGEDTAKRLFDYEAAYNSPSSQMARYQKAGLNPYLLMQQGQIASGNGQGMPAPNPSVRASVSPFVRPDLGNPTHGLAENIFAGSSLKSQRIAALSSLAKSAPDLLKSMGQGGKRVLESFFGSPADTQFIDAYIRNSLTAQQIDNERNQLELDLRNAFGVEKEQLINKHLSVECDKLADEILSLRKGREVSDAEINELFTRSAKNLAEKVHLNADTDTINQLRGALYFEAKSKASSAYSQAQIDSYLYQEKRADFKSNEPERELQYLEGKKDNELSPSERIYKRSSQFFKRLGRVFKQINPMNH